MPDGVTPNQNLCDLPAPVWMNLTDQIDEKWRDLAVIAVNIPISMKKMKDLKRTEANGDAADKLLRFYGNRGMTVDILITYLHQLRLERALQVIKNPEPLMIIKQPESYLAAGEAESLTMVCEATGFPYPRYVWFQDGRRITHEFDTGALQITNARTCDRGKYICAVYNQKEEHFLCSTPCHVTINAKTRIAGEHSESPEKTGEYGHDSGSLESGEGCSASPPTLHFGPPLIPASYDQINRRKPLVPAINNQSNQHNPPAITITYLSQSQSVAHSERLQLVCVAQCQAPLVYQWRKADGTMHPEGPKLNIDHAEHYHSGLYYCLVRNQWETVKSCGVKVDVLVPQVGFEVKPLITSQPAALSECHEEGNVTFYVTASGMEPLSYRWFHDGNQMSDEKGPTLHRQANRTTAGFYTCQVSDSKGNSVLSNRAQLKLLQRETCFAQDKVALLIGNSQCKSGVFLPAVANDIKETAKKLEGMEFKVLSFLNLTLHEMQYVVNLFCEMITPGVYALFYFGGHGFVKNLQNYMLPWDPPEGDRVTTDCLCAEEVESLMQARRPALCVMILDQCRTEGTGPFSGEEIVIKRHPGSFVCYASSYGQIAYETEQSGNTSESRGIFNKHFLDVIAGKEPLLRMWESLKQEFEKSQNSKVQTPEIRDSTSETKRTLADRVAPCSGNDVKYMEQRAMIYHTITTPPPDRHDLSLTFRRVLSNVLEMHTNNSDFRVLDVPSEIYKNQQFDKKSTRDGWVFTFENLQRLQGHLVVNYSTRELQLPEQLDLGFPLIAKYRKIHTEPTEQEEEGSIDSLKEEEKK